MQHNITLNDYHGIEVESITNGYGTHWKVLNKSAGIWYQFYPSERIITKQFNDEFFDLHIRHGVYYLTLIDKYREIVSKIVFDYLEISPIHELLVLFRLDEDMETDTVEIIRIDGFVNKLNMGELLFNKIYRVVD